MWGINADDHLTQFLVRIRVETGTGGALTPDNSPDSLARTGSYTVKTNETCSVPQPDLMVGANDITVTGQNGNGHQQVVVGIVHNLGTALASGVPVRFTVDGVQVGTTQTIASISAGGTGRASVVWDTRGQNGVHTIVATADPANVIAESNESNNSGSRTVTVQGNRVG